MDPNDLLIIPLRRWRILAACVLMSVAVGLLTLPAPIRHVGFARPLEYKATAVLGNAPGAGRAPRGTGLIEWAPVIKGDVIINAVGTQLNLIPMEVAGLHKSVAVKANPLDGTLSITDTGNNPAHVADIANATSDQFLSYVAAQNQAAYQTQLADAQRQVDDLNAQINSGKTGARPGGRRAGGAAGGPSIQSQLLFATATLAGLQRAGAPKANIVVLDRAIAVASPVRGGVAAFFAAGAKKKSSAFSLPKGRRSWMLFVVGMGFVLGLILTFVMDWLDTRFWTRADVEGVLGLPVVAEVPMLARRQRRRRSAITSEEPRSIAAAAYRGLRAALIVAPRRFLSDARGPAASEHAAVVEVPASPDPGGRVALETSTRHDDADKVRVVMVASASPGEGRTTTALNLAVCLAELGKSVLLIGYDFNNRDMARWVNAAAEPGVTDKLMAPDAMTLDALAQPSGIPNVRVVPCGAGVLNPTPYLDVTRALLDEARQMADFVVIDTAPGLVTYDASDLAQAVDSLVLVARAGKTRAAAVIQFLDQLAQVESPMLGVVLIGTKPKVSLPRRRRGLRRGRKAMSHKTRTPRTPTRSRKEAKEAKASARTVSPSAEGAIPASVGPAATGTGDGSAGGEQDPRATPQTEHREAPARQ